MKTKELLDKAERKKQKLENRKINYDSINPNKLNFLNIWKKAPKKMILIIISAFLYNLAVATFLAKAATIATGISALVQMITIPLVQTAPYFAYIYFAFNLPFIIIFWRKNSRLFMILTTYWLLFQVVLQSILLIPTLQNGIHHISIYYVNWNKDISYNHLVPWDAYGQYSSDLLLNSPLSSDFKTALTNDFGVKADSINYFSDFLKWASENNHVNKQLFLETLEKYWSIKNIDSTNEFINQLNSNIVANNDLKNLIGVQLSTVQAMYGLGFSNPTWPIIVYTIIGGVMAGVAGGLSWKGSASTAGADFVIYYISKMKQKSVGKISTYVALAMGALSIFIIAVLEGIGVAKGRPMNPGGLIVRVVSSIGYIFIYSAFIELIYPKYKKIRVEIYTKNPDAVINHFKEINYWHGYNISKVTGGYTNTETTKIETYALYLEQTLICQEVYKADPSAWVSVIKVQNVFGHFNTSKIE
ncbi:YitT family protein [[Mycoplasma] falconis]|uniref:YitT family protein n=1 Tax=[Mycoplasma] falconis TaxID=92403 RepID=UPI002411608E|nr:YitT family protein [[Mycoplasma] falconis]